jgi:glycine C-acetyltransferase
MISESPPRPEPYPCRPPSLHIFNLCANNYLGLADNPEVIAAARAGLDQYGFGMASVRFICGTQTLHRELERAVATFLDKDDAILFAACFDANGGLFEPLLGPEDAIISDALNHASIIDGVRLSKAKRYRYATSDMDDLETQLKQAEADGVRFKLIVTDGVFSMDGYVARLPEICARRALRGAGRGGRLPRHRPSRRSGRGSPALTGANERVDIVTGTFGKTLGGAMGGFIAGPQQVVDLLRQRARPYLFSNSLAPAVVAGSLKALEIAETADDLRARLMATRASSAAASRRRGSTPARPHPDHSGDDRRRRGRHRTSRRRSTSAASTSPASSIRSCRRARHASARRCRRR